MGLLESISGVEFAVWGLRSGVYKLGLLVQGAGSKERIEGWAALRVWSVGAVWQVGAVGRKRENRCAEFRVWSSGFGVQGSRFMGLSRWKGFGERGLDMGQAGAVECAGDRMRAEGFAS